MELDVSYAAPSPCGYDLPTYWRFTFWTERGFIECRLGCADIIIARTGDTAPNTITAPPVQGDYLADLALEIAGQTGHFNTETVLRSARATLELQRAADTNK